MADQFIENTLYRELAILSIGILVVLLYNNISLYKLKISDHMSVLLCTNILLAVSELVWDIGENNPKLATLTNIALFVYVNTVIIVTCTVTRFFLSRFGLETRKKSAVIVLYVIPNLIVFILALSSPWTRCMYWVNDSGAVVEGPLVAAFLEPLALLYLLPVTMIAVYHSVKDRFRKTAEGKAATQLFIFGFIVIAGYILQLVILGEAANDNMLTALGPTIALVYLTSTANTETLLANQAKIESVETDLRIASKIQQDALPLAAPELESLVNCRLRANMDTAKEVGGDFYDYFIIDDNRLCFIIADVAGKGTPAALFMMTAMTMIRDYARMCDNTAEVFTNVNKLLSENNEAGMFTTAWIGIFDKNTNTIQYTNAGHNYPLFKRKGKACEEIARRHGFVLAGMDDTEYGYDELKVEAGDRILLYTDGISEAQDIGGNLYGTDALMKSFDKAADKSEDELLSDVLAGVDDFVGDAPQFDDMTLMVLTIPQ